MKLMFMCCTQCRETMETNNWTKIGQDCTCIFLEEAKPVDRNSHTMDVYAMAVEADRLFTQEMIKTMTPEQINRFCFENGYAVPEPKEQK